MKFTYDGYRFKSVAVVNMATGHDIPEISEHNRHFNPKDLRTRIFECFDWLQEYDAESCEYTTYDFDSRKRVLAVKVEPDEFFYDMFNVYVNDKFYGIIDIYGASPYAKLTVLYGK